MSDFPGCIKERHLAWSHTKNTPTKPGSHERWPLNWNVCVCVHVHVCMHMHVFVCSPKCFCSSVSARFSLIRVSICHTLHLVVIVLQLNCVWSNAFDILVMLCLLLSVLLDVKL